MNKPVRGAALIAKNMKEYGGSMQGALAKLERESRNRGMQEGFQKGVNYALNNLSLWERLFGRKIGR